MDLSKLREWYWRKQGLDGSFRARTASESHACAGWARSVGGANPYLQTFARNGTSRAAFDAQVAALELHELPSARGCTYTVSAPDFALALAVSQGFADDASMATARRFMGVDDAEIARLQEKVVAALANGPKEPKELREELGDHVRHLGEEGKKRGMATTLPLALGFLRTRGVVRNVPLNGRVDTQRYAYALWPKNPLDGFPLSRDEAFTELARRFFRWIGPAKLEDFVWFSGLGKGAARHAVAPLGLAPVFPDSEWLIPPEDLEAFHSFQACAEPQIAFVGALDNLSHLRKCLPDLVDPSDAEIMVATDKAPIRVGSLQELWSNPIYDRGRLIGLWEYDPESASIASYAWADDRDAIDSARDRMEVFCRDELGDARSFSLDGLESRRPRIEFIRKLAES